MEETTDYRGSKPRLNGFLSNHQSPEKVVSVIPEPDAVYIEEARDANKLNFDFTIKGLTERKLTFAFIKVAVYDEADNLITYRHLNHNGVVPPAYTSSVNTRSRDGKPSTSITRLTVSLKQCPYVNSVTCSRSSILRPRKSTTMETSS